MKRVIFLEDNPALCDMYEKILAHEEGVLLEYSQTPEQIRASLASTWDLIVADLDIPGITTAEIIKSASASPLVFLTGGESSDLTAGHKVYPKQNLISLLPNILRDNLK